MAVWHPRLAYSLAGALGAARNRITRRWPSAGEVRELFPEVDAARVAAEIGALHERNRVLVHCIRRYGIGPIRTLVRSDVALTTPSILATFHVGAYQALGPALERLGRPVLAFRQQVLYRPAEPVEVVATEGDEQQRAAAFHRAVEIVRRGGHVLVALDITPGTATDTPCVGQTLRVAPGAFALARLTRAPIIPLVAAWKGTEVHVDTSAPIETPNDAAAWLERYLLRDPSQLTLGLLRNLLYDLDDAD